MKDKPEIILRPSAIYNRFLGNVDEQTSRPTEPSRHNLRSKEVVSRKWPVQSGNLPKKRKAVPQPDSDGDEEDVSFTAGLADAISFQYNAVWEPETLHEFVSFMTNFVFITEKQNMPDGN